MRELREILQTIIIQPPYDILPPNEDDPHEDPPMQIFELSYADDMNIISTNREFVATIVDLATPTFARHDLAPSQPRQARDHRPHFECTYH